MKTAAIQALRRKLAADTPVFGLWVTRSRRASRRWWSLWAWMVVNTPSMGTSTGRRSSSTAGDGAGETVALVRIAELNGGLIKRARHRCRWHRRAVGGAVEQLKQAVAFARYPEEGLRGIGGERATCWGQCMVEHTAEANEHVLVVPIIETVRAAKQVSAMVRWMESICSTSVPRTSLRLPAFGGNGKGRESPSRFCGARRRFARRGRTAASSPRATKTCSSDRSRGSG